MNRVGAKLPGERAEKIEGIDHRVAGGIEIVLAAVEWRSQASPTPMHVDGQGPAQRHQPRTGEEPVPSKSSNERRPPHQQRQTQHHGNDELRFEIDSPATHQGRRSNKYHPARVEDVATPCEQNPHQHHRGQRQRQPESHPSGAPPTPLAVIGLRVDRRWGPTGHPHRAGGRRSGSCTNAASPSAGFTFASKPNTLRARVASAVTWRTSPIR